MTGEELDHLRELAQAASPGPYEHCGAIRSDRTPCVCGMIWAKREGNGGNDTEHMLTVQFHREDDDYPKPSREQAVANARYFAALSPEVVLRLLDMIEGKYA